MSSSSVMNERNVEERLELSLPKIIKRMLKRGLLSTIHHYISVIEDYAFEKKYGVNTRGIIGVDNLDVTDKSKTHCHRYQPTRIRNFNNDKYDDLFKREQIFQRFKKFGYTGIKDQDLLSM
jgi:hypothetical protein